MKNITRENTAIPLPRWWSSATSSGAEMIYPEGSGGRRRIGSQRMQFYDREFIYRSRGHPPAGSSICYVITYPTGLVMCNDVVIIRLYIPHVSLYLACKRPTENLHLDSLWIFESLSNYSISEMIFYTRCERSIGKGPLIKSVWVLVRQLYMEVRGH